MSVNDVKRAGKCKQQVRTDCVVIEVYDDHVLIITYAGTFKVNVEKAKSIEAISGSIKVEECRD